MDRIRGFLAAVAAVAFIGLGGREVRADEVATIVNKTNKNVSLYLQWSHLDYESDLIVLGPGDRLRQAGPDGATLSMRFNSTPGVAGDPREIRVQVITRNVPNGAGPGFISYFRNRTPAEVDINDK